jgi:hypothetical protein
MTKCGWVADLGTPYGEHAGGLLARVVLGVARMLLFRQPVIGKDFDVAPIDVATSGNADIAVKIVLAIFLLGQPGQYDWLGW